MSLTCSAGFQPALGCGRDARAPGKFNDNADRNKLEVERK